MKNFITSILAFLVVVSCVAQTQTINGNKNNTGIHTFQQPIVQKNLVESATNTNAITVDTQGNTATTPISRFSPLAIKNGTTLFTNSTGNEAGNGSGGAIYNANLFGQGAGTAATGVNNVNFFGSSAGSFATSAYQANFFGPSAGYNATNAFNSNFFGPNVAFSATNANNSNFFGRSAGYSASAANNSNFFGQFAGYGAANASLSNLFGFQVGYNPGGAGIGTNNIIIGTNISLPATTANSINIGGVLFGTGTYNTLTGNPSTTPNSGGKIGIGIVPTTQQLEVANNVEANSFIKRGGSGTNVLLDDGTTATVTSLTTTNTLQEVTTAGATTNKAVTIANVGQTLLTSSADALLTVTQNNVQSGEFPGDPTIPTGVAIKGIGHTGVFGSTPDLTNGIGVRGIGNVGISGETQSGKGVQGRAFTDGTGVGGYTNTGTGVFASAISSGTGLYANSQTGVVSMFQNYGSGDTAQFQNGAGVTLAKVSYDGKLSATGATLTASPTTSSGTYEILTRNLSTGVVEKKASTFFQAALTNPITGTGTSSYLSKFTAANAIANSSWRETTVGSRLFNGVDDGYNTFQLTGSAKISNTLTSLSNYSPALSGTATYNIGVEGISNGFAEGVNGISTNGVAGVFDIQSAVNGNESNIVEFKDNGVVKASISDVGVANVNGLNSIDKITTTSSIKVGDDTSPASQYNAGAFRYRSLAEVGYPEINTQNSFGNYSWKTLWHSGNLNNLNQLTTRNFSDLQSKPTTLAGYGITDTPWTSYLPLSGGTLTGALTGVASTFLSVAQTALGFSLGYANMQLNSTSKFLWSQDGAFSGGKDVALYRPSAGTLRIYDGVTTTSRRDLNLRTLYAETSVVITGGTSSQFMKANGTLDSTVYAADSNVVHKTGNETISGFKRFNTYLEVVGSDPLMTDNSVIVNPGEIVISNNAIEYPAIIRADNVTDLRYIQLPDASGTLSIDSNVVHKTGNETISGNKKFTDGIFFNGTSSILAPDDLVFNSVSNDFIFNGNITSSGDTRSNSFTKLGGTSSQFLKADGSVDSNSYTQTNSPAFTGIPTAPTATTGTNTTQIATTEFVNNSNALNLPLTGGTLSGELIVNPGSGNRGLRTSGGSTGVDASGSYTGVSAVGGTYGVYASGSNTGVYTTGVTGIIANGTTSNAGLFDISTGNVSDIVRFTKNSARQAYITHDGKVVGSRISTSGYTVATLPSGTIGDTAYVTDAVSPTYLGNLVGGGSIVCPAFYNGTAWIAH